MWAKATSRDPLLQLLKFPLALPNLRCRGAQNVTGEVKVVKSFVCGDDVPLCEGAWTSTSEADLPASVAQPALIRTVSGEHKAEYRSGEPDMSSDPESRITTDWPELLGEAISGEGVRTVYQPIVDLRDFTVAGYEALSRFDGAPLVGPDAWFAAARRVGLAADLEATTLRLALGARSTLPSGTFVTVNIEPESLSTAQVWEVFAEIGDLTGIAVEVTGHRPVEHPDQLRLAYGRLRRAGAMVSVDQPEGGYEGLQELFVVRPDILKLDRRLVEGLDFDASKAAIVEMFVLCAERIGALLLLAGIETLEQGCACASLGVTLGQGFLFGRPDKPWGGINAGTGLTAEIGTL